ALRRRCDPPSRVRPLRMSRLSIGNQPEDLRQMSAWLWERCTAAGIPEEVVQRLDLCANEAVGNIISYAYAGEGAHRIQLELLSTGNELSLEVRDDGRAFNPLEVPEHEQPASLAEAGIGGLGVHLIRRLMTRCEYERQ